MSAMHFDSSHGHLAGIGRRSLIERAGDAVSTVFAALRAWRRRAHDRAQLAALDDRMLADIGITRAEAEFLGNRPFWKE